MNRILGYILALVGVIAIAASSIAEVKDFVEKIIGNTVPETPALIVGIILVVLGILLVLMRSNKIYTNREVPIYRGNRLVGFRRR